MTYYQPSTHEFLTDEDLARRINTDKSPRFTALVFEILMDGLKSGALVLPTTPFPVVS